MNRGELIEKAVANKASGKYNCAQAVACAFSDVAGMDETQVYNAMKAFGRGMGCMEATCGALAGAGMILGLMSADNREAMQRMSRVLGRFQERNGATICKHLKGIYEDPTSGQMKTHGPLRPCNLCVADATEFLADALGVPSE